MVDYCLLEAACCQVNVHFKKKKTQEQVWMLIQEQGLFCQDALLGPN